MSRVDKGNVVFKYLPQDFIVEELGEKYLSNVSPSLEIFQASQKERKNIPSNEKRPFLACDLEKTNIDHLSALSILSKELHLSPHKIGYAGAKDKIAWTSQRISLFDPDLERVINFRFSGMLLKNFTWIKHKIKIGDLKGNRFTITLRNADKDAIKILSKLRNTLRVPNLFGEQRFGSLRNDNFQIGVFILKNKYREAVFAFLSNYGEEESDEIKQAKKRFKLEKDIKHAQIYFPLSLHAEHRILEFLKTHPDDYDGALKTLGEKTLTLFSQSVQSALFNEIVQRAIDENVITSQQNIPLIGKGYSQSQVRLGDIEREVLKDLQLAPQDLSNLPSASRKAFLEVKDLRASIEDDELFIPSKKVILTFALDSGCYATTFLENFFTF